MQLFHHDLAIDLEDEWWTKAGMLAFRPRGIAYRSAATTRGQVGLIALSDVAPLLRRLSHGVFNNDAETGLSAPERVHRILVALRDDVPLPPVELVRQAPGYPQPYRLAHGAHRFYCSLAAGFTHIPAIVFDRDGS